MAVRTPGRVNSSKVRFKRRTVTRPKTPMPRFSKKFLGTLLCLVTAFVFLWGGWYWAAHSSQFLLKHIDVSGNKYLSKAKIIALSGVKLSKDNLLSVSAPDVSRNILRSAWISSVEVEKQLPNKLHIIVKERVPIALLHTSKGNLLIGTDGVVIGKQKKKFANMPQIYGVTPEEFTVRNGIARLPEWSKRALSLLRISRKILKDMYPLLSIADIKKVDVSKDGKLTVFLRERGVPIVFGSAPLKTQFKHAQKVLSYLYKSGRYSQVVEIRMDYAQDKAWAKLRGS